MTYSIFLWFVSFGLSAGALLTKKIILLIFFLEMISLLAVGMACYTSALSLYKGYSSLVTFFLVSSMSGLLLLIGWLMEAYMFFYVGLTMKLGFFPFCWWVYSVYSGVSWEVMVFLKTIFKVPVMLIALVAKIKCKELSPLMFLFTSLVCCYMLLAQRSGWKAFLAGKSIMSSYVLFVLVFQLDYSLILLLLVVGWAYFFSYMFFVFKDSKEEYMSGNLSASSSYWYVFMLLSLPVSLSMFYKLMTLYCLTMSLSMFYVLFIWCLYQIMEQVWLTSFLLTNSPMGLSSEEVNSRLV